MGCCGGLRAALSQAHALAACISEHVALARTHAPTHNTHTHNTHTHSSHCLRDPLCRPEVPYGRLLLLCLGRLAGCCYHPCLLSCACPQLRAPGCKLLLKVSYAPLEHPLLLLSPLLLLFYLLLLLLLLTLLLLLILLLLLLLLLTVLLLLLLLL